MNWYLILAIATGAAVLGGILSSLLTLGLAQRRFERQWKGQINESVDEILDRLGDTVETRVRKGVLDAVSSIPSTEVLRSTQRQVLRTASEIVEGGLSGILGGRRPKDEE